MSILYNIRKEIMVSCIEKLPHDCGTSDALQVFSSDEGGYTGYCFKCNTYVPDPYNGKTVVIPTRVTKTPEQLQKQISEIDHYPVVDLPIRHLKKSSLEYFNVRFAVSEEDGETPIIVYFPYVSRVGAGHYKARVLADKKMWRIAYDNDLVLFGWPQAINTGAKTLYITEGEFDAIALYQALKAKSKGTKWENYNPAVVSVCNGASGAAKEISKMLSEIKSYFQDVVLVFDQDEAGKKAVSEVLKVLPSARVCTIPGKDANECVIKGHSMALSNAALFKSDVPKNTRIVNANSLFEQAREPAKMGISWPWKKLTELTRGIRFGETYYFGAGVKMGKSEVVNALAAHFIVEHNLPVLLAKPEEVNKQTVKRVAGKIAGRIFHDPNIPFDYPAYDEATKKIDDKLRMIDLWQHLGWSTLKEDILTAAADGVKVIIIDPITNVINGLDSGVANTRLQEISQELSAIAKDLDLVIFIFCHLKAPLSGPPHERGGEIFSSQFAGSRAMMRSCNMMIGIEGNKAVVDDDGRDRSKEELNVRKLVILEDREFGVSGSVRLYWDDQTGLFNEMK